jgi:hypothetical protein
MAADNNVQSITIPASADLSAQQYRCITVDSNGRAAVANATALVVGVLQNEPSATGQAATVAFAGMSKARAGGTITAGARVTADASGNVIAATTAGDAVLGVALDGAANNDIVRILINPFPFATLA